MQRHAQFFARGNTMSSRILVPIALAGAALLLAACNRQEEAAADPAARLAQLAPVATNDIAITPELNNIAMEEGRRLYEAHCASCHGPDLKGLPDRHTPDLTDNEWMFAGDDIDTGGMVHSAADIEKTIRNGIRARPQVTNLSQRENDAANIGNKNLAVMPAMGAPGPYGLTPEEMADVTEFTLRLGGQEHDMAMAARGEALFADKGGCYDCHSADGTGDMALGSTNLTKPETYLFGSDRGAILASLVQGRTGVSPAFEGQLSPEEIKAVAVYVFSQGGPGAIPPPPQ
jgi:cytochrome c oxidase cbb3-type subunit 3